MLEIVFWWKHFFSWFFIFFWSLPNNMRCCLIIFFKGFLTPRINYFLQFSSCGPWRVFGHSNSPPQHALGRYRHTSSSGRFITFYVDWNFFIIALMVEMGIFTAPALFLKPLSNLWSSIIFCCTSEIYFLVLLFVMDD